MVFDVYYCEDISGKPCLSERSIRVDFKNKVLRFPDGTRIEVSFELHMKYKYFWWQKPDNLWKIIALIIGSAIAILGILKSIPQ